MSAHIKSDIDAYLAGSLAESRRHEVDLHTQDCEPCRKALQKARTRRAHQNREALKRASNEGLPNLLISRLSRKGPEPLPSEGFRWRWIIVLALLGGLFYLWHVFRPSIDTLPPRPLTPVAPEVSKETHSETPKEIPKVILAVPETSSVDVSSSVVPEPRRRRVPRPVTEEPLPTTTTPETVPMTIPDVHISTP